MPSDSIEQWIYQLRVVNIWFESLLS
jgi:hypothetical protein